jgi:hypothetical protein
VPTLDDLYSPWKRGAIRNPPPYNTRMSAQSTPRRQNPEPDPPPPQTEETVEEDGPGGEAGNETPEQDREAHPQERDTDEPSPEDDDSVQSGAASDTSRLSPEQLIQDADLIELREEHCRVQFPARVHGPGRRRSVQAVCGMLATACDRRHEINRAQGDRQPPGGYARLLGNRFTAHGVAEGVRLTPEEMRQAEQAQAARAAELARQRVPEGEEEWEAVPPPQRPDDDPTPYTPTRPLPKPPSALRGTRDKHPSTTTPAAASGDPSQWLGMENSMGSRLLAITPVEALAWNRQGYDHAETFQSWLEAKTWAARKGTGSKGTYSDNPPSPPAAPGPRAPRTKTTPAPPDSDPESSGPSASSEEDSQASRTSRRRRRSRRNSAAGSDSSARSDQGHSHRRHRRSVRQSKRDSSESPSEASSEGSDQRSPRRSKHRRRRSSRRDKRRSRRRNARESESPPPEDRRRDNRKGKELPKGKTLLHGDTSTGLDTMFGMEIGDDKLVASLGPPHMTRQMATELFDYPADLLALPGSWSSTGPEGGDYESHQTLSQLSDFLQTAAMGKAQHRPHDPGWNSTSHHALGKVKTPEALTVLANDYASTLSRALKYESQRLKKWMRTHHYSEQEIHKYEQTGGLPIVMRATGTFYCDLLTTLRQTILKHSSTWQGSYAQAMLDYHKRELSHIRTMAGYRMDFLLSTYTYLRDGARAKWTNQEIQSAMCLELNAALLSLPAGGRTGDREGAERRKACRCQNQALHTVLQVNYYDTAASLCPIAASTSGQKARLAAKILKAKVDGHVRQNGGAPPKATWQGWAAKAVAAAEAGQSSI